MTNSKRCLKKKDELITICRISKIHNEELAIIAEIKEESTAKDLMFFCT